jgi:hypothetical protein
MIGVGLIYRGLINMLHNGVLKFIEAKFAEFFIQLESCMVRILKNRVELT